MKCGRGGLFHPLPTSVTGARWPLRFGRKKNTFIHTMKVVTLLSAVFRRPFKSGCSTSQPIKE